MTHYYYYIEESGALISEGTRFYLVAVGHSQQADRDRSYLEEYAKHHGHFFKRDSTIVSEFISHIKSSYPTLDSHCIMVHARTLVKHFKEETRPTCAQLVRHQHNVLLTLLNTDYRAQSAVYRRLADLR